MTDYFDDRDNVEQYVKMAEGYDGRHLIDVLRQYLLDGATVLELGMGPGTDLEILRQYYKVTGSDRSQIFLERYRSSHGDADLLQIDAITFDTNRRFDGIYSNKVLHHLTSEEQRHSLVAQHKILNPGGVALHSFWYGEGEEEMHSLHFTYFTEATLRSLVGTEYDVLELARYTEMEEDDSLYITLKRKDSTAMQN